MDDKLLIFRKMVVLFFIVFFLDYGIGRFLKKSYFAQTNGYDFRTTYVVDQVRSDFLILGSSRAVHHYNTSIMQDSLKVSAYNGGRDGTSIFYYYAMLKAVLKRYQPKLVVLDITPQELEENKTAYEKLNLLLPYYEDHPEVRSVCQLRSPYEHLKLLSGIYPQNSNLLSAITVWSGYKTRKKETEIKGFLPMNGELYEARGKGLCAGIDPQKVNYLKQFIISCKKANIKLAVVISPIYLEYPRGCESMQLTEMICKDQNIPFYNYSAHHNSPKLYADQMHMNSAGAKCFTIEMLKNLRSLINEGHR